MAAEAAEAVRRGPKIIGEHTVKEGETLTPIPLKFYGEADKPFWQSLYEFNKVVIGSNMELIKPGMKLRIPELTLEHQKKKQ